MQESIESRGVLLRSRALCDSGAIARAAPVRDAGAVASGDVDAIADAGADAAAMLRALLRPKHAYTLNECVLFV